MRPFRLRAASDAVRRFVRWFRRPRTTLAIILVLFVIYASGLVIPQKSLFASGEEYTRWITRHPFGAVLAEWFGLTDIYLAPVTLFFLAAFFLNLLLVMVQRIPIILRRAWITETERLTAFDAGALLRSAGALRIRLPGGVDGIGTTARVLGREGWHVRVDGARRTLAAIRNRFSAFGFLLFHTSFLLCLIGGLLIYYSRFAGNIILTEGQMFTGRMEQFYKVVRTARIMRMLPAVEFGVESVNERYEQGVKADLTVRLRLVTDDFDRTVPIGVNRPARVGNLTILPMDTGVSPLFRVRDVRDGREYDGAWFSLRVSPEETDSFSFASNPTLRYEARFYPDYAVDEDGREYSRTPEIRNPAFHITVRNGDTVIGEGTIRKGQGLVLGPFLLEFADLRRWADLYVVREVGPAPLIAGFAVGLIGLVMRLILYRREIRAAQADAVLVLTGTSEHYPRSFQEELGDLARRIAGRTDGRLEKGTGNRPGGTS